MNIAGNWADNELLKRGIFALNSPSLMMVLANGKAETEKESGREA